MSKAWKADHLAKMTSDSAKAAYELLIADLKNAGLVPSPNTGVVSAVRFHGDGDYLFSFIVNPAHLLFYIRKPALRKSPALGNSAIENSEGRGRRNEAGEATIRIETRQHAQRLVDWLIPRIPRN